MSRPGAELRLDEVSRGRDNNLNLVRLLAAVGVVYGQPLESATVLPTNPFFGRLESCPTLRTTLDQLHSCRLHQTVQSTRRLTLWHVHSCLPYSGGISSATPRCLTDHPFCAGPCFGRSSCGFVVAWSREASTAAGATWPSSNDDSLRSRKLHEEQVRDAILKHVRQRWLTAIAKRFAVSFCKTRAEKVDAWSLQPH
jgi:hypothetical protein